MIEGIEGIQTVGIMNAIKTGNVVFDMIIAMLIPVVIGSLFSCVSYFKEILVEIDWRYFFTKRKKLYERFIQHSTMTSAYTTTDLGSGDSQNEVLIKAIQLYLDHHGLLKLKQAELELRQIDRDESRNSYYYYYNDESSTTTFADTLAKYKIVKSPMKNAWLNVGKYPSESNNCLGKGNNQVVDHDVSLMVKERKESLDDKEGGKASLKFSHEIQLHFTSEGRESIDFFIDKAYQWYIAQLRTLEDDTRYLYELKNTKSSGEDGDDSSSKKFKRYPLSDDKSFDSLFFKEKETIIKVVDHFENKTGKYAIKGYPHKLGLLLHGPPGTGKTSLIKALAQKTGRSIVNVPLARISTNAELAALFFDQKYYIDGEYVPVKLSFKDVIFVMEDVDAVSKVVRRRDKENGITACTEQFAMTNTKSLWRMLLESDDENCKALVEILLQKSTRLKLVANDPNLLSSVASRMGSIPGLSLVGESSNDETGSKIASDAVEDANKVLSEYGTLNNFIGSHAKALKRMIESGTVIDENFEDTLLGTVGDSKSESSFVSIRRSADNSQSFESEYSFGATSHASSSPNNILEAIEAMNYDDAPKEGVGEGKMMMGIGPSMCSTWKAKKDELNLSGLLNVLDGVVDTPGRMLVMTSNHPEMLDAALIRPGRIDKKLLLGHLRYEDLVCMIEHYFQTKLNTQQVNRLMQAVDNPPNLLLTPAEVEQMACEFEDLEDMIKAVESKKP